MALRNSGQGPRIDLLKLVEFSALLFLLFVSAGCASKSAGKLSPAVPVQQAASCSPVEQKAESQTSELREVEYASYLTQETDYFPADSQESGYGDYESGDADDVSAFEPSDDAGPIPSIGEMVMAEFAEWRGVRYRSGGSDYRGIDCSGLVRAIYKEAFEMDLPRTSSEQARLGEAVPRDEIRPGDLLYFIDRGRKHVGVAVSDEEFVHASRRKGVIISKFEGYWSSRLLRVRRILDEKQVETDTRKGG